MKLHLINMPFSSLQIPSIALTQLKTVINQQFEESEVEINVHYFNHEFGQYFNPYIYTFISESGASNDSGFGEWLFRQVAFPELEDNTEEYLNRYAFILGQDKVHLYLTELQEKREGILEFLDHLIHKYNLTQADIVGFTSMFTQNVPSFALARRLKEIKPEIITLMGGANCEFPMGLEIVKHIPDIDFAFSGPGLISLPQFLRYQLDGEADKCHSIDGVLSKQNAENVSLSKISLVIDEQNNIKSLGPIGKELSLDEKISLDYESFLQSYDDKFGHTGHEPHLLFETSRGCWWGAKAHCTFCGLNGGTMAYRAMQDKQALHYLTELFDRYASRVNHYSCVDNIIPMEYFQSVFPYLEVPDNVSIFYEVKADLKDEEMEALANVRIHTVQPGIEALNTSTLKLMRKGTTSVGNLRFLKLCMKHGIFPTWNLLIGFPGEQEQVYQKYYDDLEAFYHLPPPSGVFPVRFDRYSPYFTEAEKYGLRLRPLDYYALIYPLEEAALTNMVYYFADHNYEAEYIKITARWIKKLEHLVNQWNERWHRRDGKIAPQLHFVEDSLENEIYDSRSGDVIIHKVNNKERQILEQLNTPTPKSQLLRKLDTLSKETVMKILKDLSDRKLIFQEKEARFVSLVFKQEPTAKMVFNTFTSTTTALDA